MIEMNIDMTNDKNNLDILFIELCERFARLEPNNIFAIKFVLYDRFEYEPNLQTEQIKKMCEEREGQVKFRNELINQYNCCMITGDNSMICEACHIIPYFISKNFDVANGLLLNRCFHKMFDEYMFSIDSNNCVKFSNKIYNMSGYSNYLAFDGKKLQINPNSKKYLDYHYKKFININKNISNS